MTQDRRTFLKRSGAALSAAAAGAAVPIEAEAGTTQAPRLDPDLLDALAEVVLPAELGPVGRQEAVADFVAWAEAYEPVAELNHGYGTDVIRYGPPDPVPGWAAQLEALDLEARRRHGAGFRELEAGARRALLERQDLDGGAGMPNPLRARHVAVALMARWFGSPEATDRAYGRRIAQRSCGRGIASAPGEPGPVG